MPQPVLVRGVDGRWREPETTAYRNERELQELVMASPDLLTPAAMATVDEFPVPGIGYADIVGVGADGAVTVVECKLSANSQVKREVVGQVLAYAGGLWKLPYDDFAATWSARSRGTTLVESVRAACDVDVDDDELRTAVARNLDEGTFTLVIAVDGVNDELKRIVEFLNGATRPEVTVLAVELQYLSHSGVEVLIPRTYGEALAKTKQTGSSASAWTADTFAAAVEALPAAQAAAFRQLQQWAADHGYRPNFGRAPRPSASYYRAGTSHFALYPWAEGASVTASLGAVNSSSTLGPAVASRYLADLKAVGRIAPYVDPLDDTTLHKYPTLPIEALAEPGVVDAFCAALDRIRPGDAQL